MKAGSNGRSLAGIAGWNPAGGYGCRSLVLSLSQADHSSRAVLPTVVCLIVFMKTP